MSIPTILRGDTPSPIPLELPGDQQISGATLRVSYQGAERTFDNVQPGQTVSFALTRPEVKDMAVGTFPVTMKLTLSDGGEHTLPSDDARITVTDCPGDVYTGSISISGIGGDYNDLENKPTLNGVVIEGNKTSRDYHIEGGGGGSVVESDTNPGYAANADVAGVALRASRADTAENATRAQEADAAISAMSATNAGYADSAPWGGITGKPSEFAPSSHASSHATNGVDEIKPSDIGALPISYNEDDDQTEVNVSTRGGERTIMRISSNTDGHSLLYLGTKPYELGELFVGVTGGGLLRVGHTDSDFAEIQVAGVGDDAKVRIYKDEDDGRGHVKVNGSEVATEGQVTDAETRLNARIDLIEATSRPNMNIVGSPKFNQGVVSGFSANDYLMFPTQVDVGQNAVEFYMSFTTGADVTTQQNILDSWCGLAIAIRNGRFILAASQNGTEFVTGESGPSSVAPNTSYSIAVLFSHHSENVYVVRLSEEVQMVDLCSVELSAPLFATATYWGGANPQSGVNHIFGGTINLNECRMVWNGVEVWRGYDELPTVKFDPTSTPRLDTAEKIAAQSAYPMSDVVGGALKDRAVNHATAGGTFTFPVRTGSNARDFVLVIDALTTPPTVIFPAGVTYVSEQDAADVWTAEADKVNAWYFSEQTDGVFMACHKAMSVISQ